MHTISTQTLRRLAIQKQCLSGTRPPATTQGLLEVLRRLRCLQIDPIRAVERTQYLVLFSRIGPYDPALLDQVAYADRQLFEYWAHAASYVLAEDYPIHAYRMAHRKESSAAWAVQFREWLAANRHFADYILDTIRNEGPKLTAELEDRSTKLWESSAWWSSRNTSLMIQSLWDRGILMVSKRDGLKKYWDLAENVHPEWEEMETLEGLTLTKKAAQLSLQALGVANGIQIKNHFTRNRYPGLDEALSELESEGRIIRVRIEDAAEGFDRKGPWYLHADDLPMLDRLARGDWAPRTVLLSPFDNLIADRDRTERIWNFHFRIEIYVPAKKREFGYYVMPVLHGDRLIGRIDPRFDRKSGTLHIQAVYREPDAPNDEQTIRNLRAAIAELSEFLGAKHIHYGETIPAQWLAMRNN